MADQKPKSAETKKLNKSLKYSVRAKIVNFNPDKYAHRLIIVDGQPAVRISGRTYKMILAKD